MALPELISVSQGPIVAVAPVVSVVLSLGPAGFPPPFFPPLPAPSPPPLPHAIAKNANAAGIDDSRCRRVMLLQCLRTIS